MIQFPNIPFPTLDRAGITSLPAIDPSKARSLAQTWLSSFASACSNADTQKVLGHLHPTTPFWRDILALTWDFRTLFIPSKIAALLDARLSDTELSNFDLNETYTVFQQPFPDIAWISLMFNFKTKIGKCTGVAKLVPLPKQAVINDGGAIKHLEDLEWKAYIVYTNLDSLLDFPERIRSRRGLEPTHINWTADREAAREFAGADEDKTKSPKVLLIGAGQSGLMIAARLKALDVSSLVVDKNERIGDNWRGRYDSLSLHDPVWFNTMPYLPFPPTWPIYCPSQKLANWLEYYADALDINVWMMSKVTSLTQDPQTLNWHVTILRRRSLPTGEVSEQERKFVVKHVIFCTGLGSPNPCMPSYSGLDTFKGEVIHSTRYKRAIDYQGKKVFIIGASTSAHDIALDCYQAGIDVTMFQRSSTYIVSVKSMREVCLKALYSEDSPPTEISDLLSSSLPMYASTEIIRRSTRLMAALDKDILDPLHKVGFRTNLGNDDTGMFPMAADRCGGYYLDTGASKLIGEGKIKLKNDGKISHFTQRGIVFDDGSELETDVVVFSTGYGETKEKIASLLSASNEPANAALIAKIKPIWGVNSEGEINGVFSYSGVGLPGLWYMFGNLAKCRIHSAHMALQIKAMEEGIWSGVYEG